MGPLFCLLRGLIELAPNNSSQLKGNVHRCTFISESKLKEHKALTHIAMQLEVHANLQSGNSGMFNRMQTHLGHFMCTVHSVHSLHTCGVHGSQAHSLPITCIGEHLELLTHHRFLCRGTQIRWGSKEN